jgi:hypothetical protein
VLAGMFIFHPPSLTAMKTCLTKSQLQATESTAIPDFICGLSKYYLEKGDVAFGERKRQGSRRHQPDGIAYLEHKYKSKRSDFQKNKDHTFEVFFHKLFQHIEMRINDALKTGIDNVWVFEKDTVRPHGRVRYSSVHLTDIKMVALVKSYEHEKPAATLPQSTET